MPTQFQVINPTAQNTMGGGAHLHTPQSIFQHMMGQQSTSHKPGSWTQMPQVPPMCMPWSVSSLQQPHLVRFTGENKLHSCDPVIHQKRKLEFSDVPTMRPSKQFISEEKMAAHFSDMHISSNYSPTPVPSTSQQNCNPQPFINSPPLLNINANSGDLEDGKSMHPRLVISEELRRLQQEPLLPASLLSKLERPSMALVLWEPPSKHLRLYPTQTESPSQFSQANIAENNNNNNDIDNNNAQIPDLNQTEYESNNTELEPMDL